MSADQARAVFLGFGGAFEAAHMGHPDFRVRQGIFATLWPSKGRAVLRLGSELAAALAAERPDVFRVVGRSGGMGWLGVELARTDASEFADLAATAHALRVAPRK